MVSNRRLLINSAIITTIIFLIGVFLGYQLDNLRTIDVLGSLRQSELDAQSYITEQEFFENFGGYRCELAQPKLTELSNRLGELGFNLVNYDGKNIFKQKDYDYLLRKYFLEEIRTYTLFSQLKNECKLNNTLILYFFNPGDIESERQGRVLDVLGKKYDGISVFSINFNYNGDTMVNNIKLYYNVTSTPTIIINSKNKLEEFVELEELEKILGKDEE